MPPPSACCAGCTPAAPPEAAAGGSVSCACGPLAAAAAGALLLLPGRAALRSTRSANAFRSVTPAVAEDSIHWLAAPPPEVGPEPLLVGPEVGGTYSTCGTAAASGNTDVALCMTYLDDQKGA